MHTQFGKTIVGFSATDLAPSSLAFARWWSERTGAPGPTIVHVAPPVPKGGDALIAEAISRRAHESAAETGRSSFPLEIRHAAHTEAALVDAFKEHHADFLVLRRRSPRWHRPWPALGHFSRALVRHVPCSMVIVPPDWTPPSEPGPVIVVATPDHESRRAIEVSRRASEALEVELIVAHAIDDPDDRVGSYYTATQIEAMRAEHEQAEHEKMKTFLDSVSLPARSRVVSRMGDVTAFAMELTHEEHASLVFVGVRPRPLRERLLTHAFQTDLAAHLPVPFALIADPWALGCSSE